MCSNETVSKMANIFPISCTFKKAVIVGGSQHAEDEASICETCIEGDGCNGATGASQIGSIAVIIAIPMAIIKNLLLWNLRFFRYFSINQF